jgi:two-component system OmpR family response regulator
MRILIIEDEDIWAQRAREAVADLPGAQLEHARTGADGRARALAEPFDLLILDRIIKSDGTNGLEILAALRERGVTAPALILSSLGETRQRVEGLESGADDYLAKPFDAAELRARLRSLARRAGTTATPAVYVRGALEVWVKARSAHYDGRHIPLSPQEFDILAVLAELDGDPADRDLLWKRVWTDFPNLPPQINVIDVALARLRRAMTRVAGVELIHTVRLKGWCLPDAPTEGPAAGPAAGPAQTPADD